MDGILIINKTRGLTSHDVVYKVRKLLKIKKVGHTGTLDPMATGVLLILIGKATKISKYLIEHDKQYIATIKLGEKTDTGDAEGKCIEKQEINACNIDKDVIEKALEKMIGPQMQKPPMYSAIKVKGKKLYEYARNGIEIEVEPRKIEIYDIKLINIDKEQREITFLVNCSKGTYIRVLCEQIAEKLGTFGHMKELKRISVNQFSIDNAISLEQLEKFKEDLDFISKNIIKIEKVFENKKEIILNDFELHKFLNGVKLLRDLPNDIYRIYDKDNKFIGIGINENGLLKRDVI